MFTEAPVSVSVTTTHYYKSEMEVYQLANIKSAKKRILVNRTKAARNKSIRSAVKTSIKKVEAAVQENNKAAAQAALTEAISTITKTTVQEKFPVLLKLSTALANSGNTYF